MIDTGANPSHYQYGEQRNEHIIQYILAESVWFNFITVSIAVDWITDKVYWTNNSQILVYDLHSRYVTTVINSTVPSGTSFRQIVIDPGTR